MGLSLFELWRIWLFRRPETAECQDWRPLLAPYNNGYSDGCRFTLEHLATKCVGRRCLINLSDIILCGANWSGSCQPAVSFRKDETNIKCLLTVSNMHHHFSDIRNRYLTSIDLMKITSIDHSRSNRQHSCMFCFKIKDNRSCLQFWIVFFIICYILLSTEVPNTGESFIFVFWRHG